MLKSSQIPVTPFYRRRFRKYLEVFLKTLRGVVGTPVLMKDIHVKLAPIQAILL